MLQTNRIPTVYPFLIILFILLIFGCSSIKNIREFHDPTRLNNSTVLNKSIKVHMTDGTLYLLDSLIKTGSSDTLSGFGSYYNQYRELTLTNKSSQGYLIPPGFIIPLNKVALFETNDISGYDGKVVGMTIVGVPTAIASIYCIINPKACFGSCPTFYGWDGKDTVLMAEGFSSSILRAYEKEDIDMLYNAKVTGNNINLKLTNEALETHVIRYADLLVLPRKQNERIFADEHGKFTRVTDLVSPSSCTAPEGDCLEKVLVMDQKERYSVTDSNNLAEKECVELNFNSVPDGNIGLIIGNRQTFLTTFLFYQSLAYLGHSAGNFAASIETGNNSLKKKTDRVWEILGGIDIFYEDGDGNWIKTGQINEMGPIASDVHLVRLPVTGQNTLKLKLRMTKGLWRIDYLALARLGQSGEPLRLKPSVTHGESELCDRNNNPQLSDTLEPLITLPGDSYNLSYHLPSASEEYEVFLCSKGYYLEWMREPWLAEENLKKAALLFGFPELFMKKAAKEFKLIEPNMEENFWNSRYAKKN